MDDDWVNVNERRSVIFPRLPAGKYEFQVAAGTSAGVWSEPAAPVNFVVTPFFWETRWFQAAMVGIFTVIMLVVARLVFQRGLRKHVHRLEEENALQRERARIAQDIHDDFGACMTQISLLAELAQQNITRPQQAGEHVGQIATMSREGMKSLDEIVWAVNPRNDTLPDLLDFAGQHAVNFLQTAGIRCRIDFPDMPPERDVSSEVRHELFLAVKEALHNVVKHSQATEVWLRATIGDRALKLIIEDNGRGFEKITDASQADGVRNMRKRLSGIGGKFTVDGRPGKGTTIQFEVPWQNHG
jgi:signal transduction histidine kinase